jgi:hypothetical protein
MPASSKTSELLDSALHAHGGVDRWNTSEEISAAFVAGGGLMPMKGMNLDLKPLEGTATIHHESTVITPFGKDDQRMVFTPRRVLLETLSGTIVAERSNPRGTFAGHTLTTPWDMLQWSQKGRFPSKGRAYVGGPELRAIGDLLLISIDLSDFRLKAAARRRSE